MHDSVRRQAEFARESTERIQRQNEVREMYLWWKRFYQFFDQQRDELQRRQQEDINFDIISEVARMSNSAIRAPDHPLHWLLDYGSHEREKVLRERLDHAMKVVGH